MEKDEYLANNEVKKFILWAVEFLPSIKVNLDISSKGTRNGGSLQLDCIGLDSVVNNYKWQSEWKHTNGEKITSYDWQTTHISLGQLGQWLKDSIKAKSEKNTLDACKAILTWGGDRNGKVGALPKLISLRDYLPYYLENCQSTLNLDQNDYTSISIATTNRPKERELIDMNSMLTKIHALASYDFLPIYDSRVAAATACLVELYRLNKKPDWNELPNELKFPATDNQTKRRVIGLNADAIDPGKICRITKSSTRAKTWTSAKIRLGWLMREILDSCNKKQKPLFQEKTLNGGSDMHAFEASLFMIGFNVFCLKRNTNIQDN